MISDTDRFIHANGIEIFYKESGDGVPLILLHGGTNTHQVWDSFIPHFSKNYRVITPDSRGHGRTINPASGLSYRVMAEDLAAFIEALDLEYPILFGYSDGGQILLEFGMLYPEIAKGLVIGGAWYRFSQEYQAGLKRAGYEGPGEVNFGTIDKYAPPDWRDRMRQDHPRPNPDDYQTLLRDISQMWWTPLGYELADFKRIKSPTLILIGELDEMIPISDAREMADMIPGAELAVIADAKHNHVLVEGGKFLQIVDNFLSRLDD